RRQDGDLHAFAFAARSAHHGQAAPRERRPWPHFFERTEDGGFKRCCAGGRGCFRREERSTGQRGDEHPLARVPKLSRAADSPHARLCSSVESKPHSERSTASARAAWAGEQARSSDRAGIQWLFLRLLRVPLHEELSRREGIELGLLRLNAVFDLL